MSRRVSWWSVWTWRGSVWTIRMALPVARLASVRFQDGVMMPLGTALLRLWQRVTAAGNE